MPSSITALIFVLSEWNSKNTAGQMSIKCTSRGVQIFTQHYSTEILNGNTSFRCFPLPVKLLKLFPTYLFWVLFAVIFLRGSTFTALKHTYISYLKTPNLLSHLLEKLNRKRIFCTVLSLSTSTICVSLLYISYGLLKFTPNLRYA